MSIEKNLRHILDQIEQTANLAGRESEKIVLLAVTKGRSLEEIREAYDLGLKDFGENRIVEALEKMEKLPADIRWHFIGKLQKNKVKKAIGRFVLIHSVDNVDLAEKIAKASREEGVETSILLESNTSGEITKSGLAPDEWKRHFKHIAALDGIKVHGLMTMAPLIEDEGRIRYCFSSLRKLLADLQKIDGDLTELSMGMTHDFNIAIQEGATIVRVGTALFMPQ